MFLTQLDLIYQEIYLSAFTVLLCANHTPDPALLQISNTNLSSYLNQFNHAYPAANTYFHCFRQSLISGRDPEKCCHKLPILLDAV